MVSGSDLYPGKISITQMESIVGRFSFRQVASLVRNFERFDYNHLGVHIDRRPDRKRTCTYLLAIVHMYITITAPVMQFIFDWQQHYTGPRNESPSSHDCEEAKAEDRHRDKDIHLNLSSDTSACLFAHAKSYLMPLIVSIISYTSRTHRQDNQVGLTPM